MWTHTSCDHKKVDYFILSYFAINFIVNSYLRLDGLRSGWLARVGTESYDSWCHASELLKGTISPVLDRTNLSIDKVTESMQKGGRNRW